MTGTVAPIIAEAIVQKLGELTARVERLEKNVKRVANPTWREAIGGLQTTSRGPVKGIAIFSIWALLAHDAVYAYYHE
jgi:hypothetical protein